MKRNFALILSIALVIALCACGNNNRSEEFKTFVKQVDALVVEGTKDYPDEISIDTQCIDQDEYIISFSFSEEYSEIMEAFKDDPTFKIAWASMTEDFKDIADEAVNMFIENGFDKTHVSLYVVNPKNEDASFLHIYDGEIVSNFVEQ